MPNRKASAFATETNPTEAMQVPVLDGTAVNKKSPLSAIKALVLSGYSVAWSAVTGKPSFATVATSGRYDDLSNKPTIPDAVTPRGAGAGLTLDGNDLDVNPGDGIEISSDKVRVKPKSAGGITVDSDGVAVTNPFTDADETRLDSLRAPVAQTTAPSNPVLGQLWVDTSA